MNIVNINTNNRANITKYLSWINKVVARALNKVYIRASNRANLENQETLNKSNILIYNKTERIKR